MSNNNYNKVEVLIVGAGPAGLAAAIQLKALRPQTEVAVIEKGADLGNHNPVRFWKLNRYTHC